MLTEKAALFLQVNQSIDPAILRVLGASANYISRNEGSFVSAGILL